MANFEQTPEAARVEALALKVTDLFRAEGALEHSMPVISTALTEIVGRWLSTFEDAEAMVEAGGKLLQYAFVAAGASGVDKIGDNISVKVGQRSPCSVAERDHQIAGSDETQAAVSAVLTKAREMKLFGALILSPKCPDCGQLHDFGLISNLKFGKGGSVADLLMDFAFTASQQPGEEISNDDLGVGTVQ